MIRTVWAALNLFVATTLLSSVIIVASFFTRSSSLYDSIPRLWAAWVLWSSNVRVVVEGAEHVAQDRPQVIASNHTSWYDVVTLAVHVRKRYRFVGKQELTRVPLFGRAWVASGHISIDRSDRARAFESLELAGRTIREDGSSVIIFPEGTRSPTGQLQPFKKGAFMLALQNGVEIVPAAIVGAHRIMPRTRWRVCPGTIILRFGPPVATTDFTLDTRDELLAHVRDQMQALLDAPVPEN